MDWGKRGLRHAKMRLKGSGTTKPNLDIPNTSPPPSQRRALSGGSLGTGRSDDHFFDHFEYFLHDLTLNGFRARGPRPVRRRISAPWKPVS